MFISEERFRELCCAVDELRRRVIFLEDNIKTIELDTKILPNETNSITSIYMKWLNNYMGYKEDKPIKLSKVVRLILDNLKLKIDYIEGTTGEYKLKPVAKIEKARKEKK